MENKYKQVEDIFPVMFPLIKNEITKHSEMVMDHTGIWDGIEEIQLEFHEDELEVYIYLSGEFLDFPILDVDHHMMGIRVIWPWIEKSFLRLYNVRPLKDFKKVILTFIDSNGDADDTELTFK